MVRDNMVDKVRHCLVAVQVRHSLFLHMLFFFFGTQTKSSEAKLLQKQSIFMAFVV